MCPWGTRFHDAQPRRCSARPPARLGCCTRLPGLLCPAAGAGGCRELLLLSLTPSKPQPLSSDPRAWTHPAQSLPPPPPVAMPSPVTLWSPLAAASTLLSWLVQRGRALPPPEPAAPSLDPGAPSPDPGAPSPDPLLCPPQLPGKMHPSSQLQDHAAWGHQQVKLFSGSLRLHLTRQEKLHTPPAKFRADRDWWAPLPQPMSSG